MKSILTYIAIVACIGVFGKTSEEYIDEFHTALSNNQFSACAESIRRVYQYKNAGNNRIESDIATHLTELMWEKWLTTDEKLTFSDFKVMVRDSSIQRYDLVEKTLKKDIPPEQLEVLLFDFNWLEYDMSATSEFREIVHKHLQDKCIATNIYPICVKYKLAMTYWPNEFYLINYDKSFFTYESPKMSAFFYVMLTPSMYHYSPLFLQMAEKYLEVCKSNSYDIMRIVSYLDEVYDTHEYQEKYYDKFNGNFNVQFEIAYNLYSENKIVDLLNKNTDNLTEQQVEKTINVFTSVEDDFRKDEINTILSSIKEKYGNRTDGNWSTVIKKVNALIELRD